jgi:sugar lactone lactonase YvrE
MYKRTHKGALIGTICLIINGYLGHSSQINFSQIQGTQINLSNLFGPNGCTFTPSGDEFVVINAGNHTAYSYAYDKINKTFATNGTQINLSNVQSYPIGCTFTPSGDAFVIVSWGNTAAYSYAYDKINKTFATNGTQINLSNLCEFPGGCTFTPSGDAFMVMDFYNKKACCYVYDIDNKEFSDLMGTPINLPNLDNPTGCAFTPSGDNFLVANWTTNGTVYSYPYSFANATAPIFTLSIKDCNPSYHLTIYL